MLGYLPRTCTLVLPCLRRQLQRTVSALGLSPFAALGLVRVDTSVLVQMEHFSRVPLAALYRNLSVRSPDRECSPKGAKKIPVEGRRYH